MRLRSAAVEGAGARRVHDLLVAEGRRYANTPRGARLRDGLVASEAVENLRRDRRER
ncbi:hypothetical protein MAHJHV50_50840 [Mycobacterium avium subsp. hominissuis]